MIILAHFHALFAEHRAVIEIDTLAVRRGYLPGPKLNVILRWAAAHRHGLRQAWELTQARLPVRRVE
jgi:hypothetical protein